jgi:GNAT superfamily N-acetyltransferase
MSSVRTDHPLGALLARVAAGEPPPADGRVEFAGPPPGRARAAVLSFTSHHVVAAAVADAWVSSHLDGADNVGPMRATFLTNLAEQIDCPPGGIDAMLVALGTPGPPDLVPAGDRSSHPRAARARHYRDAVQVFTTRDDAGVVVIGRGLAGRWEVAVEVDPAHRGRGVGRSLFAAARGLVGPGEALWAQVSPAHVASLRAVLAAGFRPVGAEVLYVP